MNNNNSSRNTVLFEADEQEGTTSPSPTSQRTSMSRDRKQSAIQRRILAIADHAVKAETKTLALHSHMDFIALIQTLRNIRHIPEIVSCENLSLYRIDLDYNLSHEVIQQLSFWKSIELDSCEGTHMPTVVTSILKPGNNLMERLGIVSQPLLDGNVMQALGQGLPGSQLQELSLSIDLSVEWTNILCEALNQSPHLIKCDLSECELDADAVDVLCESLAQNTTMKSLKLEHCRLEDYEIASLVTALQSHPTLQELSFRMNYAQEESWDAISELLRCSTTTNKLQRLNIAQQNPGIVDLATLAQGLAVNKSLISLDLHENFVEDAHMPALVRALRTNTTLKELHLENCELGNSAWSVLMEGLSQDEHHYSPLASLSLTHLWLTENKFCRPTYKSNHELLLLSALSRNRVLQVLDVEELSSQARWQLCLNRAGRQFLALDKDTTMHNPVPLGLWPIFLARVNVLPLLGPQEEVPNNHRFGVPDVLYFMLQGPALLER